ncbi:hypothetical protein AgCh_013915 [Apium graveolens]
MHQQLAFREFLGIEITLAYLQINKEYAKFRKKGLEPDLVTKNDVIHPNSTDENVVDLNDSEDDAFEKSGEMYLNEDDDMSDGATTLGKRKRKGKGKLESQSNISENKPKKEAGYTIKDAMDDLHNIPDIEKGSDLYFFAVSMFEHKEKRELWKHLETADAKVGWLKY